MGVGIDHENVEVRVIAAQILDGERHIVEHAKTVAVIGKGVVGAARQVTCNAVSQRRPPTGRAVADIIFGEANPSGHLPLTIPRNVGQLPLFYNHKPSALRGYLFDSTEPLFPFGHGLSYTSFEYGEVTLENDRIGPQGSTVAKVEVTNAGERTGSDVVQLYLRDRVSSVTRPVQELRDFERVTLDPGETTTVSFAIGPDDLSYYGTDMEETVDPGAFDVMVGHSATDIAASTTLRVTDR